jgi:hypothetical protein
MAKLREIIIRPSVTLPALSTVVPERSYSYMNFLAEWVYGSRGMRKEENLGHLFELEEAIEAFARKIASDAGVTEPVPPEMLPAPPPNASAELMAKYQQAMLAIQKEHSEAIAAYQEAVQKASVGAAIYVSDAAFLAAKAATKDAIDKASERGPQGQSTLHAAYESKILRHFHGFAQSKLVDERDVPSNGVSNGRPEDRRTAPRLSS